jgi:hypothetical protein
VVRAAMLPDTAGGRAVAVGLIVLLCVAITAVTMDRLPLWTTLLGTAALTGAYEFTYAAAPPELATTSVSTATTLLFNVAVGFLAAALVAPHSRTGTSRRNERAERTSGHTTQPADDAKLDDFMMEKTQ